MGKLTVAIMAAALLLGGCMGSMTPEQKERMRARMAETPQSVGPNFGPARDRDELIRSGEINSW